MKKTLITSALPYANGYIHLGHAAGAYLPADIFARYKRLSGENVLYVCGSDEHGVAITISADKEKVSPQEIIDKYHEANKCAFDKFAMSFDIFSRTSLPEHHVTAREFFADFLKKGYLIEKEEEQFYDTTAAMFLPDRYVEGECPNCGYQPARGDQCDNCGAYYNQTELINPKSIISGNAPEVRKTTHWYAQFGKFQEFLENYINSHESDWKDNVLQQTRSWLKKGLSERAITRDLIWGVEIEGIEGVDPDRAKGKRLYVWFDAVLGYITATKIWAERNGRNWKDFWQSEDTDYYAFIGKDNIVFHTLIFPALLHGKDDNFIMPKNVPANEFLNLEGEKFSKSRGWSIDLKDFLDENPSPAMADAMRYALAVNFPESKDSDFTWAGFQARNNNELAAIFGNFVNRSLQFLHKNFEGKVPTLNGKYENFASDWTKLVATDDSTIEEHFLSIYGENDFQLVMALKHGLEKVKYNYDHFRFRDALLETMNLARASNKYFNDEEPWKSIKNAPEQAAKTIFACCQLVRTLAVVFAPITPLTSEKIFHLLREKPYTGTPNITETAKEDHFNKSILPLLASGTEIEKPNILFTRIEDEFIEQQKSSLGGKKAEPLFKEEDMISIDDFMKVKLRTAKILSAEIVKKSNKLLKLQVDIGGEERQILAGIAKHYKPEYLVGKTIVVVANLKPAKLMGELSEGMMLAASDDDGNLCFVSPESDKISEGAEVR